MPADSFNVGLSVDSSSAVSSFALDRSAVARGAARCGMGLARAARTTAARMGDRTLMGRVAGRRCAAGAMMAIVDTRCVADPSSGAARTLDKCAISVAGRMQSAADGMIAGRAIGWRAGVGAAGRGKR